MDAGTPHRSSDEEPPGHGRGASDLPEPGLPEPGLSGFLDLWAADPAIGSTLVLLSLDDADGVAEALARLDPGFADELAQLGFERLRACATGAVRLHRVDRLSFIAVMPDCLSAEALGAALVDAFARPLAVRGLPMPLRIGVGLRAIDEPGEDAAEILRSALAAARESRARPLGWRYHVPSEDSDRRGARRTAA
jgi:GGDEF domain-containing protein